jgi:hypothetical protein
MSVRKVRCHWLSDELARADRMAAFKRSVSSLEKGIALGKWFYLISLIIFAIE